MSFTGGAPAVVNAIFQALSGVQEGLEDQAGNAITAVFAAANNRPRINAYQAPQVLQLPDVRFGGNKRITNLTRGEIAGLPLTELSAIYGAEVSKLATAANETFQAALDEFEVTNYFSYVEDWFDAVLDEDGGFSGVDEDVENRLWLRENDRVNLDAARAADEAATCFAARGFQLSPAALSSQAERLATVAQTIVSEAARERVLTDFRAEVENVKLVVTASSGLRQSAILAATQYMSAVADAEQFGLAVTQNIQATHDRLNTSLYEFLDVQRNNRRWNFTQRRYDTEERYKRRVVDDENRVKSIEEQIRALTSRFMSLGQSVGSALNGLNASATISGTDVTTLTV